MQSPKGDISYMQKFFLMYVGGRMPLHLQEDFCGTALLRYIGSLVTVFYFFDQCLFRLVSIPFKSLLIYLVGMMIDEIVSLLIGLRLEVVL